ICDVVGTDARDLDHCRSPSLACEHREWYNANMRQALTLHPGSRCTATTRIEVEIKRPRPSNLVLTYLVTGRLRDLHIPHVTDATRAHELWQHTLFEVFVRASPSTAYYEFNFSPSMQWAAYRFSAYRRKMSVANDISAPRIEVQSRGEFYK